MRKYNWNNVWINARLLLILAGLILMYSFTLKRNGERKLTKTIVEFTGNEERFVSDSTVDKLLIEKKSGVRSIRKDKLALNELEKTVDANAMIKKSEVFVSINGVLTAVIEQKTPVVRVVDKSGSFYIDYEGDKMPLSEIHSARVPLVSGLSNAGSSKKFNTLFQYIHDDDFLKKNVIGLQVLPSGSLLMKCRNNNYVIEFGRAINIERKFDNYKAFFQKATQDGSIDKYKVVNLKFTQQVVCTK